MARCSTGPFPLPVPAAPLGSAHHSPPREILITFILHFRQNMLYYILFRSTLPCGESKRPIF